MKLRYALILLLALTCGCAGAQPKLDTSADAELTYDGLIPVKNSAFKRAWAEAADVEHLLAGFEGAVFIAVGDDFFGERIADAGHAR